MVTYVGIIDYRLEGIYMSCLEVPFDSVNTFL